MYVFFGIFLITAILFLLINHWRKAFIIKKVCAMSHTEKYLLLNELVKPLGYQYIWNQGVFVTTVDAWQREFGYTRSYDCLAAYFNMVFDSEPVYFNYDNRTWLIEFWKGQYGINTGAEIGIYRADEIIPRDKRKRTLFHAVPDEEMPLFTMRVRRGEKKEIAEISLPHWWLAAFRMGCFSKPDDLCVDFCIDFGNCDMRSAFAEELMRMGYRKRLLQICGSSICFSYDKPKTPLPCGFFTRGVRRAVQVKNRLFCRLYRFVTRPFCRTCDRLLYLYFYLPFVFRRCIRLCRGKKRFRDKRKCRRRK